MAILIADLSSKDPDTRYARTDLGKHVSHSDYPNANLMQKGNSFFLTAIKDIEPGQEIISDYERLDIGDTAPLVIAMSEEQVYAFKTELEKNGEFSIDSDIEYQYDTIYLTPWGDRVMLLDNYNDIYVFQAFKRPDDVGAIVSHIGEEKADKLFTLFPEIAWRAETGIEILIKPDDVNSLQRNFNNFRLMDIDKQKLSDNKSVELYGKTNADRYAEYKGKLLNKILECMYYSIEKKQLILEGTTYFQVRNFITLLLRKVKNQSTRTVLKDIYDALMHFEVIGTPMPMLRSLSKSSKDIF